MPAKWTEPALWISVFFFLGSKTQTTAEYLHEVSTPQSLGRRGGKALLEERAVVALSIFEKSTGLFETKQ